jgi:hypothetical protein
LDLSKLLPAPTRGAGCTYSSFDGDYDVTITTFTVVPKLNNVAKTATLKGEHMVPARLLDTVANGLLRRKEQL